MFKKDLGNSFIAKRLLIPLHKTLTYTFNAYLLIPLQRLLIPLHVSASSAERRLGCQFCKIDARSFFVCATCIYLYEA